MAEFPTDLLTEILSRLPVKSLLRCQLVCKSWNSLIKTPIFIKIHLNKSLISNSDHHLLLFYPTFHFSELDLDLDPHHIRLSFSELNHPLKPHKGIQLIGSCNGVVCISTVSKARVVLYNPLTNSHLKLPSVAIPAHDPNKMVLGFGYDSSSNSCKVVRIVQGVGLLDNTTNNAQVYSYNDNSWRCIEGIPYYLYYGYYHGVLVNEGLHYVVTQESHSESLFIARFDLATESFSLIECPNYNENLMSLFNSTFLLIELGGCLCLMINSCRFNGNLLDEFDNRVLVNAELWVMKEYGDKESWVKLLCISQPKIVGIRKCARALVYSKDGRRVLIEIDGLEYGWYDLELKHVERIAAHGLPTEGFTTITLLGSLVLLEDKVIIERKTLPRNNKLK
uniref:F-box domain-containing protein n=2 Tax=Chenopodium quinoa TaxID=63459 RepID=A0A803MDW2_CHEQI